MFATLDERGEAKFVGLKVFKKSLVSNSSVI